MVKNAEVNIEETYSKYAKLLGEKGISSYQVSKDLGIEASTLSRWKSGCVEPKVRTMIKIAKYLEVPISYFYE